MVKVKQLEMDGYRGWKTVKIHDIELPEFTVDAVIKYLTDDDEDYPPSKRDFTVTCKGQVINYMGEELGQQFILIG